MLENFYPKCDYVWALQYLFLLDKLDALSEVAQSVDFGVKDERQNNVLHVLAKMEYSGTVFNCFKLVTKRAVINPKLRNTDGKKPADFIKKKTDERVKFLEELEKTGGTVAGTKKKKKKKKKKKTEETESTAVKEEANEGIGGMLHKCCIANMILNCNSRCLSQK